MVAQAHLKCDHVHDVTAVLGTAEATSISVCPSTQHGLESKEYGVDWALESRYYTRLHYICVKDLAI